MTRLPKTDKITPIKAHLWKHKVAKPESKTVTRCNDRSAATSGNIGRCSLFVYEILLKGAELHKVVNGKDTVVAIFDGKHFVEVKGK